MANKILETLKKNNKPKTKQIDIPTEKELYNLIANIYLLKTSQLTYISPNTAITHLIDYIYSITNQLYKKLINNTYHFNIQALIKYIDKSMFGIGYGDSILTDTIFEYDTSNITIENFLSDTYNFIDTYKDTNLLNGYNTEQQFYKLSKLLHLQPFYKNATNKLIDTITPSILTDSNILKNNNT